MRGNRVREARRAARAGAGWKERAVLVLCLSAGWLGPNVGSLTIVPSAEAQVTAKVIQGKVLDGGSTPLPGGIVYLQDQKTNVVKTFIATDDGSYRFGQLPSDTDYKIWAEFKGQKSKEKLISSFDTKMNVTLDFHLGGK